MYFISISQFHYYMMTLAFHFSVTLRVNIGVSRNGGGEWVDGITYFFFKVRHNHKNHTDMFWLVKISDKSSPTLNLLPTPLEKNEI